MPWESYSTFGYINRVDILYIYSGFRAIYHMPTLYGVNKVLHSAIAGPVHVVSDRCN